MIDGKFKDTLKLAEEREACATFGPKHASELLAQIEITEYFMHVYADQGTRLFARIAELEAATRWIPVEERLPLDNQIVIGYIWFSSSVVVCSYCKWEGAFYEYWRGGQVTVTHWQPLPQPPEVQE